MKARCLAMSCCLIASAGILHANGGGYFRGGVENTGDVAGFEPKATGNIRILDEKLTIKLGPKEADVEVRYLMRNVTDKKVKVRFGFPVEESFDMDFMAAVGEEKIPDGKRLAYCKNYQITAAGKAVKVRLAERTEENQGTAVQRCGRMADFRNLLRGQRGKTRDDPFPKRLSSRGLECQ